MYHPLLSRITAPMFCAIFAVTGGLAAGAATTNGLHLNSYGVESPPALVARDDGPSTDNGYSDASSERYLGYQWASERTIRSAIDCPNDSWNFARGCLDYVREPAP